MTDEVLKPCPFCGSPDAYLTGPSDNQFVCCPSCGCAGPGQYSLVGWNTRAASRAAPKVKPLVWEWPNDYGTVCRAATSIGTYSISDDEDRPSAMFCDLHLTDDGDCTRYAIRIVDDYLEPEEVQAFAQSDYERRILSALTPTPVAPAAVTVPRHIDPGILILLRRHLSHLQGPSLEPSDYSDLRTAIAALDALQNDELEGEVSVTPATVAPAAVTVKPLEWEDHPDKSHAVAIGWVWECVAGKDWNLYTRQLSHTVCYPHGPQGDGSLIAAKAAAQADYESRILSQVNVTPAPVAGWRGMDDPELENVKKNATDVLVNSVEGIELAWYCEGQNDWMTRDGTFIPDEPDAWMPLPPAPGEQPVAAQPDAVLGPITKHTYSPDIQAQGDCRVCGHTKEGCVELQSSLQPDAVQEAALPYDHMPKQDVKFPPMAKAAHMMLSKEFTDDEKTAIASAIGRKLSETPWFNNKAILDAFTAALRALLGESE